MDSGTRMDVQLKDVALRDRENEKVSGVARLALDLGIVPVAGHFFAFRTVCVHEHVLILFLAQSVLP